jgi:hypothetical protein
MKAKGQDKNGMDLYFTIGSVNVKKCDRKGPFSEAMKMARPQDKMHTDIRTRLGIIFDGYCREAKINTTANKNARNLTIIILTDGIWAGTADKDEVRRKIVNFIDSLNNVVGTHGNRPVSIEFVQFGDDPEATDRLRSLDNDLKWQGIP